MAKRIYKLDNIKIDSVGYFKEDRKVSRNGKKGKYCFISLPLWMENEVFDLYLIPKEKDKDSSNKDKEILKEEEDESVLQQRNTESSN
jgi:hypothetical protein